MKKQIYIALGLVWSLFFGVSMANAGELQRGELHSKNLVNSTVTIGLQVYAVTEATEITDSEGKLLTLHSIAVSTEPDSGKTLFAEFVASGNELERLKVLPLPQ